MPEGQKGVAQQQMNKRGVDFLMKPGKAENSSRSLSTCGRCMCVSDMVCESGREFNDGSECTAVLQSMTTMFYFQLLHLSESAAEEEESMFEKQGLVRCLHCAHGLGSCAAQQWMCG